MRNHEDKIKDYLTGILAYSHKAELCNFMSASFTLVLQSMIGDDNQGL